MPCLTVGAFNSAFILMEKSHLKAVLSDTRALKRKLFSFDFEGSRGMAGSLTILKSLIAILLTF